MTLEFFREEGIWDLIFSENFFYFDLASEENDGETFAQTEKSEMFSASSSISSVAKVGGVNSLQMEVISFLEFAATSNGNAHNLVGFSFFLLWYMF
ncbi:BEACH domain-containing protein B isoform X1 [Senna tora]|uniref:BEACH domain-containing protein B isoform X1 n=1 Tax=Senna tora TaxID=362788 RepID=A0A834WNH9_9FABA|nr:BEACH domain-containing protein B isoform X1 [Senna tora]